VEEAPPDPPAPTETKVVIPGAKPDTTFEYAYPPPPPPFNVAGIEPAPPPPMASTDTNETKSAGTAKVVPDVMNTVLTAMANPVRSRIYGLSCGARSGHRASGRIRACAYSGLRGKRCILLYLLVLDSADIVFLFVYSVYLLLIV
jgi:hypothetical protein